MIDARFLLGLVAAIALGVVAAGVLGFVNVLALQPVFALSGAALAYLFFRVPDLTYAGFVRFRLGSDDLQRSLAALGCGAASTFAGLGAFVLSSAAMNATYVDEVWKLWFPGLPLCGAIGGMSRFGYGAVLRWLEVDSQE